MERIVCWLLGLGCACYAIALGYIFFAPTMTADEIAFFVWAGTTGQNEAGNWALRPLFRVNLSAYGPLYWTIYINAIEVFGAWAIWFMRGVAFVAYLGIPLSMFLAGRRVSGLAGLAAASIWISMPVAWWTGKINGPETISMGLLAIGGFFIAMSSLRKPEVIDAATSAEEQSKVWEASSLSWSALLGWVCIGMALALKLTMLPVAVFVYLASVPWRGIGIGGRIGNLIVDTLKTAIAAVVGFVVACPLVLTNTSRFLKELAGLPGGKPWDWSTVVLTLDNETWAWDGVYSGGCTQWLMSLPAAVLLGIVLLVCRARVAISLASCFLLTWLMIASKGALLGWYWFGLGVAIPLAGMMALVSRPKQRWMPYAFLVVAVVNLAMQYPIIYGMLRERPRQIQALKQMPQLQVTVDGLVKDHHYDSVIDYSEIAHQGGLRFPSDPNQKLYQTTPFYVWGLTPHSVVDPQGLDAKAIERGKLGILSASYEAILRLAQEGTQGQSTLVILSNRLISHIHYADFAKYLDEQVIPKSPPGTKHKRLESPSEFTIYEIGSEEAAKQVQ